MVMHPHGTLHTPSRYELLVLYHWFCHYDHGWLLLAGLDRDKLIMLAFLLGSDYTEGLEGTVTVHAYLYVWIIVCMR